MSKPFGEAPLELPIIVDDPRRQYSAVSIKDLMHELLEAGDAVIATGESSQVHRIEHRDAVSPDLQPYRDALDATKADEETTE